MDRIIRFHDVMLNGAAYNLHWNVFYVLNSVEMRSLSIFLR